MSKSTNGDRKAKIRNAIERYFEACNAADYDGLIACFAPNGTHYFPAGSPFGVLSSPDAIARAWIDCVDRFGSTWTVDRMVIDAAADEAVIEWTHFQPKRFFYLRGAEWYLFDENCRMVELRAYYAAPSHPGSPCHELDGFPYRERGYSLVPFSCR